LSGKWLVGGNGTVGIITTTGLYTAPSTVPNPSTVVVTAVSHADPTVSGNAMVTLTLTPPPVTVSVTPKTASVEVGAKQQFAAAVSHATVNTVSWAVNDTLGGNSQVGSISTSGLYTAPTMLPSQPVVTVKAISNADPTKFDTATVTIEQNITVGVAPQSINVMVNTSQQFTATVSNTSNKSVGWTISGNGCSGSQCGAIDPTTGLYTAPSAVPSTDANVLVTATSAADPTKFGTATVTVTPVPTPTVTISGPLVVDIDTTYTYSAQVTTGQSQSVIWNLTCLFDAETPPDCTQDSDGDEGASEHFVMSGGDNGTPLSITVPTALDPGDKSYGYEVQLTATSVAVGTDGTHGKACIIITTSTGVINLVHGCQ
jgi:hypothetical protein